jgi:glucokinase-like ROK family protein
LENIRIGNKDLIKDINKAKVIEEIRTSSPISRTDIAKKTNLGLSTITKIIAELGQQGLILEIGEGDSSGGRKPIHLEFNNNFGYVIGIKVETERVVMALRNLNVELIQALTINYPASSNWPYVIDQIKQGIRTLKMTALKHGKEILGLGLGVSGIVDIKQGILLYSRMLNWDRVPFKEILEKEFDIPVSVDNDVNTYALAELLYGAGKIYNNFICVSIGVGIGAGIILNHQLYRGEFGGAGEFGHFIVNMDGEPCYCGQRGCLENYASDKFIIHKTQELLAQSSDKNSILYAKRDQLSISDIYEAARRGDVYAKAAYNEVGKNIGIGLANIINVFNPAAIIVTGEGIAAKEFIADGITRFAGRNYFASQQTCPIIFSELGKYGWEIGAATAAIIELFEAPIYQGTRSPLL